MKIIFSFKLKELQLANTQQIFLQNAFEYICNVEKIKLIINLNYPAYFNLITH